MSKYTNITSATNTDLISSADFSVNSLNKFATTTANVNKIMVANTSASTATITLAVYQLASPNTTYFLIENLDIPPEVTFVWDEEFSFNVSTHKLRITNSGSSPGLTVITN